MNPIDFSKFQDVDDEEEPAADTITEEAVLEEPATAEPPQEEEPSDRYQGTIDFDDYDYYDKETWAQWAVRNGVRGGVRTLEGFSGTPGNIREFMTSLASSALESEMSEEDFKKLYDELNDPEKYQKMKEEGSPLLEYMNFASRYAVPLLGAPTSTELKEEIKEGTKGTAVEEYIQPRNFFEEKFDDTMTDFGQFLFPGGSGRNVLQKFGMSVIGNVAPEALGVIGASESTKQKAKMGLMLTMDLASRGNAYKHGKDLLDRAEKSIPRRTPRVGNTLITALNGAENEILRGGRSPSKDLALDALNAVRERILPKGVKLQRGTTIKYDASEIPEMNRIINEYRSQINKLPRDVRNRAHKALNEVQEVIHQEAADYGKTNQKFYDLWTRGNEAYTVASQSEFITNMVNKNYKEKFKSDAAKILFFQGSGKAATVGKTAAATAALSAPYQAFKIAYRIAKSKELARYYAKTLAAASAGNVSTMNHWLKKLDEKLAIEEAKKFRKTPMI